LTVQEENLAINQAKAIGHLPDDEPECPTVGHGDANNLYRTAPKGPRLCRCPLAIFRLLGHCAPFPSLVATRKRCHSPGTPFSARAPGKVARAEPVAALYKQGRVHHVGTFSDLEGQCCMYTPGESSPDRMDALVWALTDLMVGQSAVDPDALAEAIRIADEMFGKGAA